MTNFYRVYGVYDKVAGIFGMFFHSKTDGLACRTALSTLRFPIRDTELYCLGDYSVKVDDLKSTSISFDNCSFEWYSEPRLVSWDSYKFPEDTSEALAPLNLSADEIAEISRRKIDAIVNSENKE